MVDNPPAALVTGGEGGLGMALRNKFASSGWSVRAPGRAELDVRDRKQVRAYFARLDRLDVLVCNAGIVRDGLLARMSNADWNDVIETNLTGAFHCVKAALDIMLPQKRGHIILISSLASRHGTAGQSNYAAAKAGLIGFGQSIAREYGGANIRCNIVFPGFLETKMTRDLPQETIDRVRGEHALGRFNTVENAAQFIAFLADMDAVSGQVFNLDSRIGSWI